MADELEARDLAKRILDLLGMRLGLAFSRKTGRVCLETRDGLPVTFEKRNQKKIVEWASMQESFLIRDRDEDPSRLLVESIGKVDSFAIWDKDDGECVPIFPAETVENPLAGCASREEIALKLDLLGEGGRSEIDDCNREGKEEEEEVKC